MRKKITLAAAALALAAGLTACSAAADAGRHQLQPLVLVLVVVLVLLVGQPHGHIRRAQRKEGVRHGLDQRRHPHPLGVLFG